MTLNNLFVLSILIRGEQKFRARKVRQARNNAKSTMPFSRPTYNRMHNSSNTCVHVSALFKIDKAALLSTNNRNAWLTVRPFTEIGHFSAQNRQSMVGQSDTHSITCLETKPGIFGSFGLDFGRCILSYLAITFASNFLGGYNWALENDGFSLSDSEKSLELFFSRILIPSPFHSIKTVVSPPHILGKN